MFRCGWRGIRDAAIEVRIGNTVRVSIDEFREFFYERLARPFLGGFIEGIFGLVEQFDLAGHLRVFPRVVAKHPQTGSAVMGEMVFQTPMQRRHYVAGLFVIGQVNEPITSVGFRRGDKKRRVESRAALFPNSIVQTELGQSPPILILFLLLQELLDIHLLGYPDPFQRLPPPGIVRHVVDERVRGEGQDDLRARESGKNLADIVERDIFVTILVKKE